MTEGEFEALITPRGGIVRAISFLAILMSSGCIAGKAGYYLVDAEQAYRAAEEAGAAELAVYEFTLAKEYRDKAWEEAGYSDYGPAEEYAKKSLEYSQKAEKIAETGAPARKVIEALDSDQGVLPELVDRPLDEADSEKAPAPKKEPVKDDRPKEKDDSSFDLDDEDEDLDWLLGGDDE